MSQHKGRLIKPETTFIDHVVFEIEETGGNWSGQFELPVGAAAQPGETYRVELYDGRAGRIRVTGYNDLSTKGAFVGVEPLS